MIYWQKDKKCNIASNKEIESFIEEYATSDTINKHHRINLLFNMFVPFITFLFLYQYTYALFAFALSFL